MLEDFCKNNNLNCLFLNGPIHKGFILNSELFLNYKNKEIKERFSYIKYFPYIFEYDAYKIGDSRDHIDPKYKNESTRDIYNRIKFFLR